MSRRLNLTSNRDGFQDTKRNNQDQSNITAIKSECKEIMNNVGETGGKKTQRQHSRSNSHSGSDTYVFVKPPAKPLSADSNRRKISSNSNDSDTFIVYNDEAINVSNVYGGKDKNKGDNYQRLLIISSKVRNSSVIRHALLSNVIYLQYNYDVHSLDEILAFIEESIGNKKVASVAMVLSCNQSAIQITAKDDKILCQDRINDTSIKLFFTRLIDLCIDKSQPGQRLDLLALSAYQQLDIPLLTHQLQDWTGVTVGFAKDFVGNDIGNFKKDDSKSVVGDMYFRLEKLRFWSGRHQQSLAGFEKIRTVGKGAYGAAVLYKKKDDDSVVILKEINMHDLSAAERQLALNEVNVLAMLDHPNIISYYDSFEEDGVLMIEMEYADGGTLKQFLYQQEHLHLDEKVVLEMFQQIVAAIRYIHEHKILHRDLKTDNIFLTKEGIIKVGDFGISKMMSSAQGANTVLGTPYYISPEMCEGKPYSFKSDIWALGCILYEMACLQKTFEGTNLPALVNKIMKGQFAPVKEMYSPDFRDVVLDMLQNDPDKRPDATELMYHRLPPLIAKYDEQVSDPEEELNENENANKKIKMSPRKMEKRSVMYYLEASTGKLTCVNDLPPRIKIKNAAVGPDHVIVVTTEEQVYSWGVGSKGQLGHGNTESKGRPELIEALNGKSIVAAQCGDGFSLFRSENGLVLTCGDGSKGCLGHGDWSDTFKPRLIEALLSVDVVAVTCGPNHVVGVSSTGEVYTWGQGSDGKLGLGDDENYCQPMLVTIDEPVVCVDVRCGIDGTMILTDIGSVFACGSNENNKLGLNNRQGFLMAMKNIFNKTEVEGRNVLTPVRSLARHRVIDICMGAYHSAVVVESGHVYMFGRNSEGQLGTGNIKPSNTIVEVKALHDKCINKVVCGEHFTVASTKDHQLYYWGLRYTVPSSLDDSTTSRSSTNGSLSNTSNNTGKDDIRPVGGKSGHHRQSSSASVSSVTGTESLTQTTSHDSGIVLNKEANDTAGQISGESQSPADSGAPSTCDSSSGFRPLSSVPHRSLSAGSRENVKVKDKDKDSNKDESVILLEPKELIRIKQVNEKVLLGNIFIHGENLFVQVETTAPPPRRKALKKRSLRRRLNVGADGTREVSASSREGGDEYSSEASEIDSQGSIPAWLRQELINCNDEDSNGVYEADDTSDQSSGDETRKAIIDSSMSSIQVNKDISPVKSPSKRRGKFEETQKFLRTPREVATKDTSTRNRTLSNNSTTESGAEGLVYDSSSSEPVHGKITPRNTVLKVTTVAPRKTSASSLVKPKSAQSVKSSTKIKSHGKGKGKGFDADIKEQLEARGFVSDVTVKRREEALLGELELMKEERAKAERLIKEMEGEQQLRLEQMKKEAQKHVEEREKGLQNEVENLRKQLEYQSSLLHSNQLTVQQLQEQLNRLQSDASSNTSTPRNSDATSSLSHKSSKVCSLQ